jgi:DNA-binding CsgD family transcriptional regulator
MAETRRRKILALEGAPGSGKTRLLIEAAEIADRNGFTVVICVPGGSSSENRLIPRLSSSEISRPGTSRNNHRPIFLTSPVGEIKSWFVDIGRNCPVFVVFDDLHLIDPTSLSLLGDLIANLHAHPIAWMMAWCVERESIPCGPVEMQLARFRAELIPKLEPLSSCAVAQVVSDCLGAIPDPAIVALAEGVGAMPGPVIDLVHGLIQDGDLRIVDGTAHLNPVSAASTAGNGACPEVPKRFVAAVNRQLYSLSPFTKKALKLAAVLGSSFAPKNLSMMLGESPVSLLTVLDEALSCGLVVCRSDDFAFRSEPVWRVVLDSVPPPVRVLLHRQAATMLLSEPGGMEAAALHLAHSAQHGDAEAVQIISQAAERLLAADPMTAASLVTRGMDLLEPEQPEWAALVSTAVEAFVRAGRLDQAVRLAEDTITEVAELKQTSTAHAEAITSMQAWAAVALLLKGRAHHSAEAAHRALATPAGKPAHQAQAEVARLVSYCLTDDCAAARCADEILAASDNHPCSVRACALTVRAWDQWRAGRVDKTITTLCDAIELNGTATGVQLLDPRWILALTYIKIGDLEGAKTVIRATTQSEESSEPCSSPAAAILRASVNLVRGRFDDADEDAQCAVAAMAGGCMPILAPQAWGVLTLAALRRGDLARAKEHLGSLDERFPWDSSRPWWAMRFLLAAQLAEAQGGPPATMEALDGILVTASTRRELLLENPAAAAWCVRSALAASRQDIAGTIVDTAESIRTKNQNQLAVCAGAMHARALLNSDIDVLAQVAQFYREPWAQASAYEDRGVQLIAHDDRDAAISDLERAMNGYNTLGSEQDAARVRRRLRRLGIRRRHWAHTVRPVSGWDSLTKTERKVAEQVATGLTNRQVASQLFISPHTVGFHLRQIYRKLEIRSRIDLIRYRP